jgi:hypothetical protein
MIRYALVCNKQHEFESWFSNSAAYDKQVKRGLVACPVCGSVKVEKALMRPQLGRTGTAALPNPPAAPAPPSGHPPGAPVPVISTQEREIRHKMKELRDHLVANSENVGPRFPDEARKMHYGETEHRSIYGVASPDDARKLHEEGVEFSPLPVLPDERN